MNTLDGWIFDVYVSGQDMAVWMIDRDGHSRCFHEAFRPSFYVGGDSTELRRLLGFLLTECGESELLMTHRRELFHDDSIPVIEVKAKDLQYFTVVVERVASLFPDLTLYNVDLAFPEMYLVQRKAFPLAFGRFFIDDQSRLVDFDVDDSPWAVDYELPPLKRMVLRFAGDAWNPQDREHAWIEVETARGTRVLNGDEPAKMLETLRGLLLRDDPDLIVTDWGDMFLLPRLTELAAQYNIALPFDRDPSRSGVFPRPYSYASHGQTVYRPSPQMLWGRWHIDRTNALLTEACGLEGIFEVARLTGLPVQWAARSFAGPSLQTLEMAIARERRVLIPRQPLATQMKKPGRRSLIRNSDREIGVPSPFVEENVTEIRLVSLCPNLISGLAGGTDAPDTRGHGPGAQQNRLETSADQKRRGLVRETLAPLLRAQREYIDRIKRLDQVSGPNKKKVLREIYRRREAGLDLVLNTAYGCQSHGPDGGLDEYTFVTDQGQQGVIRAKQVAERHGYRVLDATMKSLWVQKSGRRSKPLSALTAAISQAIRIPVLVEATFRWVQFVLTRERAASPNRRRAIRAAPYPYLGVLESGAIKVSGIEIQRRTTPPFIASAQAEMLNVLAGATSLRSAKAMYGEVITIVCAYADALRSGAVPRQELVVTERYIREPQVSSWAPEVGALTQELDSDDVTQNPEDWIQYVLTEEQPDDRRAREHDLISRSVLKPYDAEAYVDLLLNAAATVLLPLGVPYQNIRVSMEGRIADGDRRKSTPPSRSQSLAPLFELVGQTAQRGNRK